MIKLTKRKKQQTMHCQSQTEKHFSTLSKYNKKLRCLKRYRRCENNYFKSRILPNTEKVLQRFLQSDLGFYLNKKQLSVDTHTSKCIILFQNTSPAISAST